MVPRFADRADVRVFEETTLEARLGGSDLIGLFEDQARRRADETAIIYLPTGTADGCVRAHSYENLSQAARRTAALLRGAGACPGDCIASLLPNGPGTIAAALAGFSIGVLAPINYYLEPAQILLLLEASAARFVLFPTVVPAPLSAALATVRAACEGRNCTLIEIDAGDLAVSGPHLSSLSSRCAGETVALFHTGGTTGLPKFVPLSAHNLAAGAVISAFAYGYGPGDRVLAAMPMFHVGGLFACGLFPLLTGGSIAVLGPLGYRGEHVAASAWTTAASIEASVIVGPPTIMARLAEDAPRRTARGRLRLIINGAAALPVAIGERLRREVGVPVIEPWGLTEATLAVVSAPRDGPAPAGSAGCALPYCAIKSVIVDADGKALRDAATDEIGVLAIKGPMTFSGYLNAARQPFFEDGWLDTGDLGRVDADGFVWVTGRAKELIKRGGHGVDPSIIENALAAHPAVALAAAIGKPDAYAGELPIAYVELRSPEAATEAELLAFAAPLIPERAAMPKEIVILPKLPVTAIGKVHKLPLKRDAVRRAAIAAICEAIGPEARCDVAVDDHPRHGLHVEARVSDGDRDAAVAALARFAFHATIVGG